MSLSVDGSVGFSIYVAARNEPAPTLTVCPSTATTTPAPLLPTPCSTSSSCPLSVCVRHVALVVATDSLDASQSWVISSDHFAAYANPERASPLDTSRATVYNRITYA